MTIQSVKTFETPATSGADPLSIPALAPASSQRGVPQELKWRQIAAEFHQPRRPINISRWSDARSQRRRMESDSPTDSYVVSVAITATLLTLARGSRIVFEGVMPSGTLYVTGPGEPIKAEFRGRCDILHIYVSNEYVRERGVADSASAKGLNDFMLRDTVAQHLASSLIDAPESYDEAFADSVARTIVNRILRQYLTRETGESRQVSPLPRWRLKRVQDYVDRHVDESVTLADLAAAAGLSRMHFAAQFRKATGFSPGQYVRLRRIERAKQILSSQDMPLAEVAFSVGFQAQAHFSHVFRRVTGESPARWRRAMREFSSEGPESI